MEQSANPMSAGAVAMRFIAWTVISISVGVFLTGFAGFFLIGEVALLAIIAALAVFTLGIGCLAASSQ